MQAAPNGIVLIDKPAGITSFGVVARVRRQLSEQADRRIKVGHAGTLDPFATGLLILLVGPACREAGRFLKLDKTYEVTMVLGQKSTTGDPEGEITPVSSREPAEQEIRDALQRFSGEIMQTPPIYSAIKINGVRAYQMARKGREVTIEPRPVMIHQIELLQYSYPEVKFRCKVGSGTYIRSLVEDIGEALGIGAYTAQLRRTKIAGYSIANAQAVEGERGEGIKVLALSD